MFVNRIRINRVNLNCIKIFRPRKMHKLLTCTTSRRWLAEYMGKRSYCQTVYTQGQTADNKIREYFYYIDHEGMVHNKMMHLACCCSLMHFFLKMHLINFSLSIPSLSYRFGCVELNQLFLDDARMKNFTSCFKDKQFLRFFFKRLRFNATQRYRTEFPYVSLCGTERNYVRCDDLPIVFTDVIANDKGKCGRICLFRTRFSFISHKIFTPIRANGMK